MLSEKQCEVARVMTQDTASDTQINKEYSLMPASEKEVAAKEIGEIVEQYHMPFDKGIKLMKKDFLDIAAKFSISPSTLFCIYMDSKQK